MAVATGTLLFWIRMTCRFTKGIFCVALHSATQCVACGLRFQSRCLLGGEGRGRYLLAHNATKLHQ